MRTYTLKTTTPTSTLNLEDNLNAQQRKVVTSGAGPMLVIAGAGSGKTHTLTYRVAHLIERGVHPERILLLTFTNKAADAMGERITSLMGANLKPTWSGTFHSIAHRVLRQDGHLLGYPRDYSIIDSEDAQTLLTSCTEELFPTSKHKLPKARVLGIIHSMCVNTQRPLHAIITDFYPYLCDQLQLMQPIMGLYQERKLEMALMDFDDLLLNWLRLLLEFKDVHTRWATGFEHVLVDEYQDTNHLQGLIVDLLSSVHGNIMVVGDDCQSIYAFRGADFNNILEFPKRHERCAKFRLETNYRSTPEILELANRSILNNTHQFKKTLHSTRAAGPKPVLIRLKDVHQQSEFVCQRILELHDEGMPWSQIAVLYRAHYHSMELQVELTKRRIPYVVRSGLRFFDQAHVKDILAYLRVLYNPRDELSFIRLVQQWQSIGAKRARQLFTCIKNSHHNDPCKALRSSSTAHSMPNRVKASWQRIAHIFDEILLKQDGACSIGALIETILDHGYNDVLQRHYENADARINDLEQLANYAHQYEKLDVFLGEITLLTTLTGQDILVGKDEHAGEHTGEHTDEYVTLSSIHQSKGLEWRSCFFIWLAKGHVPHPQSTKSKEQLEEERRLFYVATTRAKDNLYLCRPCMHYSRHSQMMVLQPSPFISELEVPGLDDEEPWERWSIE